MQLVKLQKAHGEFEKRGYALIGISVDKPKDTIPWVNKAGLKMPMLSDPEQRVIERLYHLQNPRDKGLAIHAIYIVDQQRRIFYRKIGRRRPYAPELIAAIDYHENHKRKGAEMVR